MSIFPGVKTMQRRKSARRRRRRHESTSHKISPDMQSLFWGKTSVRVDLRQSLVAARRITGTRRMTGQETSKAKKTDGNDTYNVVVEEGQQGKKTWSSCIAAGALGADSIKDSFHKSKKTDHFISQKPVQRVATFHNIPKYPSR